MPEPQKSDDDDKFNETLKRMLATPPKPKKGKTEKQKDGRECKST